MLRPLLAALVPLVPLVLVASTADAAGPRPLASARLDLRGDGQEEEIAVDASGQVTVSAGGRAFSPVQFPAAITAATIERKGGPKEAYLFVWGQQKGGGRLLLVATLSGDRLEVLHNGPVGPLGHDGERSIEVEFAPQGPGLVRYQTAPEVSRCDGERRLFAERHERRSGWQPLPILPERLDPAGPRLRASLSTREKLPEQALPTYRFTAASAQAGVQDRADLLTPPRELEDGRPDTAWRVPGDPRGAWVTARAERAGHEVRALRLVPAARQAGRRAPSPPRSVALVSGAGPPLIVDLVPGSTAAQWVVLREPVKTSCISLLILSTSAAPGEETGLGEVTIYSETEAEGPAGLVRLASGTDTAVAEEAARSLVALAQARPDEVRQALRGALLGQPPPDGTGRRRLQGVLVQVVQAMAQRGQVPAEMAALLAEVLAAAPADEQPALWAAVDLIGEAADKLIDDLSRRLSAGPAVRAGALGRLGRRGQLAGVQALLSLILQGALPPVLRQAAVAGLGTALRCRPQGDPRTAALREALRAGLQAGPAAWERAAELVQALTSAAAGCPQEGEGAGEMPRREAAATLIETWRGLPAAPAEGLFVLRYRVLQGLGQLAVPGAPLADLLREVILKDPDPVLRAAAVSAAGRVPGPDQELCRRGLLDPDPGVRLAALSALSGGHEGATLKAIEHALAKDQWPQVRRAAAEARAAACPPAGPAEGQAGPQVPALRRALGDPDAQVQRLALSGLARCEGVGAAGLLAKAARNGTAPPALRGQACALLVRVQGPAAAQALAEALLDVLQDPEADDRHAGMAMTCARALGKAGGPGAVPPLLLAAGEPLSPPLRKVAVEALGKLCKGQADARIKDAIHRAQQDPDAGVRAAATAARCVR